MLRPNCSILFRVKEPLCREHYTLLTCKLSFILVNQYYRHHVPAGLFSFLYCNDKVTICLTILNFELLEINSLAWQIAKVISSEVAAVTKP